MIRVAAVADVHFGTESCGSLRPHLEHVAEKADVLLLAGDLTRRGEVAEATILAEELDGIGVPVVAVLGNHDFHADEDKAVIEVLEESGIRVLEGHSTVVHIEATDGTPGATIGIAGTKGFGGGFAGACATDFGEPEMKAFIRHTRGLADRLEEALAALDTDVRIALMHFAPIPDTLAGERLEIFPWLGSYLLGEAVDRAGADLVVHGHAHGGTEKGVTAGGVVVRNVAQPVIRRAYNVYCLPGRGADCEGVPLAG